MTSYLVGHDEYKAEDEIIRKEVINTTIPDSVVDEIRAAIWGHGETTHPRVTIVHDASDTLSTPAIYAAIVEVRCLDGGQVRLGYYSDSVETVVDLLDPSYATVQDWADEWDLGSALPGYLGYEEDEWD